ncbi:hypothetical protein, variant [Aphanomyces invadans]|uniref:Coiled-coil SMC6 And NSE5 INteracting (CANIN) domain-containing protein n=1 Tax=Aphanomyces invadans TaxID=157072 RepID=A0A024UEX3_9STRA|nr:hypothetical protein, variant [Aphanomyces invadans]ETW04931.1 hypothetical protein, variant [Aphanomyces invadans]|eukprot:XP_008866368.1 hypothetical protein, variant [Aphanomyces invadans]
MLSVGRITPKSMSKSNAQRTQTHTPQKRLSLGVCASSDDEGILDQLKAPPKRTSTKSRKKSSVPFDSLDALFAENNKELEKKQVQQERLEQLRKEAEERSEQHQQCSSLKQMSSEIENNIQELKADEHLFTIECHAEVEEFGYVFEPISEPLVYTAYKATGSNLSSPFKLVYECMSLTDDIELGEFLWSQAILLLAIELNTDVPADICKWLFTVVSCHSNHHVVQGAFMNLLTLLLAARPNHTQLMYGLPKAMLCRSRLLPVKTKWQATMSDFFVCFRMYGFKESKRGLNSKSKATGHATTSTWSVPFPTVNAEHITMLFVLVLRAKSLQLSEHDICSCCVFFLRMQFEDILRPQLCELSSYCIEVLLDAFSPKEWRRQYARLLILRIAGIKEGFFQSSAGWLSIARRLPRTERGTQLTTGLAVYILQYRPSSDDDQAGETDSDEPLKFPVQIDLVLDIVSTSVDSLTEKYAATDAREVVPPYDLICTKIALMDLALQAFLNHLKPSDMTLILQKLDMLALANKATVVVQWHEMKTLVTLMHRKYSAENLRIGREHSPKAKQVLFIDD